MNKIPSVFLRNPDNMQEMTRKPNPLCDWVLRGEGVITRKYDGTCVMLDENGKWWARHEVKPGKTPPENFRPVETDDHTGKTMGWIPIKDSGFKKAWMDAWTFDNPDEPGTYELCGPKVNGNPEHFEQHTLIRHAYAERFIRVPPEKLNEYDVIKATILGTNWAYGWEGFVWHHPDGQMAKMKARDYRLEGAYSA